MTLYEHLKRRLGQDGPGLDTGVTPGQGLGPVSAQGPGLGSGLASGPGLGFSPSVAAGLAGAMARFNAVTLIAPLELVKTLQVMKTLLSPINQSTY